MPDMIELTKTDGGKLLIRADRVQAISDAYDTRTNRECVRIVADKTGEHYFIEGTVEEVARVLGKEVR